jgi:prepilin-type N-terminal cleavage/methylation domain-containing protein
VTFSKTQMRGFTLIEITVVCVLISVGAALAGPSLLGWRDSIRLKGVSRELASLVKTVRIRAKDTSTTFMIVVYRGNTSDATDERVSVFSDVPTPNYNVTGFTLAQLEGTALPPSPLKFVQRAELAPSVGFGPGITTPGFSYPYTGVSLATSCSFCSASWGAIFFDGDGKLTVSNGTALAAPQPSYFTLTSSPSKEWTGTIGSYYSLVVNRLTGATSVWNSSNLPL